MVARYACQFGHVYDAVPCWSQCPEKRLILDQTGEWHFCTEASAAQLRVSDFRVIISHMKTMVVKPYSNHCCICRALEEHPDSLWRDSRGKWVAFKKIMHDMEDRSKSAMDECSILVRHGFYGHSEASRWDIEAQLKRIQLDTEKARLDFDLKDIILVSIGGMDINCDIVRAANRKYMVDKSRTLSISARKFFTPGNTPEDEAKISPVSEGIFVNRLISTVQLFEDTTS